MQMLMNGWTYSERRVWWNEVFHYVMVLWLYLLLINNAMVKEGVPCVGIMLIMRQYVYLIYLLRENIWFFNMKNRDLYSLSKIQRLMKRLEKLGLITAELFPYVFLFTWGREQAETDEASTAGVQSKNRQNSFLLTASEAVVEDS
jgi:hypothetical protein